MARSQDKKVKNAFKQDIDKKNKPKKKKVKKTGNFHVNFGFFQNELFQRIFGLFLVIFSVFLLFAFVSHFFYWKIDNNYSNLSLGQILTNTDLDIRNWGGNIGATLSYMFLNKWFGVASVLILFLLFISGIKLITKISLFHIGKAFKYSFFGIIWIPCAFGFLFAQ
jgi:S-DNA-T family DNA segregation ATPase FtsK/SpoIIIE